MQSCTLSRRTVARWRRTTSCRRWILSGIWTWCDL